jgi:hypothetical protein
MLRSVVAVALLGVLAVSPLRAADPETPTVSYKDDRLTLRASDMPVADLMEALKRDSGAEIRGEVPSGKVSATFDAVPLREALGRILGDRSFTLTYADDGHLKAIELKGGPTEWKPPAAAEAGRPTDEAARSAEKGASHKERVDALAHVFDHRGPVQVKGKLAEASGKSEVDWAYLLRTAGSHEEQDVRVEAFRTGVQELDQNPEMRADMVSAMSALTDEELAQFARLMLGPNAQGVTKYAARLAHSPDLRGRLRAVVRQLRIEDRQQASARG